MSSAPARTPGRADRGRGRRGRLGSGRPHGPRLIRRAEAPARSRWRPTCAPEELIRDGEAELLFPVGDAITLAGRLERLCGPDPDLAEQLGERRWAPRGWSEVADSRGSMGG